MREFHLVGDVIIGTAAVKNPDFVREACKSFPRQIIVGLDAKDGMVAIDGWATVTEHHVIDLAKRFEDDGVNSIIYTDIGRDGMMSGVNIDATVKLAQAVAIPIIASGGLFPVKFFKDFLQYSLTHFNCLITFLGRL